jgi:hypothetical protein
MCVKVSRCRRLSRIAGNATFPGMAKRFTSERGTWEARARRVISHASKEPRASHLIERLLLQSEMKPNEPVKR